MKKKKPRPANHHFQSISIAAECCAPEGLRIEGFHDIETETVIHLAGTFASHGLADLFFEATGLKREWEIPPNTGGPDPYLKPRGGTKMKKSNKKIH